MSCILCGKSFICVSQGMTFLFLNALNTCRVYCVVIVELDDIYKVIVITVSLVQYIWNWQCFSHTIMAYIILKLNILLAVNIHLMSSRSVNCHSGGVIPIADCSFSNGLFGAGTSLLWLGKACFGNQITDLHDNRSESLWLSRCNYVGHH